MHKSQIFFYILLAFICGVLVGSFFNISQNAVLVTAIICALLIAVFYRRGSRLLNPRLALAAFLMIFFLGGVLRYTAVASKTHNLQKFAEAQAQVIDPQNKHPIKVIITGYISGEPALSGNNQKFIFYAKQLIVAPYTIKTDEKILVATSLFPKYQYGEQLRIYGSVKLPENYNDFEPVRSRPAEGTATSALGRSASNGFDYRAYLAKDGVFTLISFPKIEPADLKLSFYEKTKLAIYSKIFAIKNAFESSIERSVAQPNSAFIEGILLGSRSQIPQNIKDAFARTSTSHILAVSGYNITIVATIISSFFLIFFRRQTAFWFSIAGILLFTILTGAQASVVRAAIMGILVLLAYREGRLSNPRNAIVLVGAIMVFINPAVLRYDVGFQLSFAATLGLIYASPVIEKYFAKLPKLFDLRETFIMTLSAQVFVLPLLLYYFKSLSLTSIPANIIVLPTIPFAMLLGFITGIAGMIMPFLGQVAGYFAWLVTSVELGIIKLFAEPSWAAVSIGLNWYAVIIVYVLMIIGLVKLSGKKSTDVV